MNASNQAAEQPGADTAAAIAWKRQILFWFVAAVLFTALLFLFSEILLPFVAGLVLAYFLDPIADRLQSLGLSRLLSTVLILLAFVIALALVLVIVIPLLVTQFTEFAAKLPEYLNRLQQLITSFDPQWLEERFGVDPSELREGLNSLLSSGTGILTSLFASLWQSGLALVSIAGLFVVTPVVAFYMLLDWDHMVATVDGWVPRDHVETVREIARDINRATAGFVRGQGTLCLILGAWYAIGLTVVGLNFGILIGLFAGLISFIPYVGSIIGLVLALGVALVQFWPEWQWIVATACVFFVGQFVEGNILQPKLVGSSVGVHPVWLMFALFAFGALFGFVGLLLAVPLAAAVAVLMRFVIARYLESPLYKGHRHLSPILPAATDRSLEL